MVCPYCLSTIQKIAVQETTGAYACPVCKTVIPRGYVDERDTPKCTVGVVGFSGHGKTVYLTSLFSTIGKLSKYWDGFYFRSLDDYTHKILYDQVPKFERGILPESTPANFPNPALINYNKLPLFGNSYLGFYDTAGEVFNDSAQISRAGFFVAHSDVVLFILSLQDCDPHRLDDEMSRLLDTYVRAVKDHLNINLKAHQQIIVIFSKADLIDHRLPEELHDWLDDGEPEWYVIDLPGKVLDLQIKSTLIEEWLRDEIGAARFINMINDNFRQVRYTLVSATGMLTDTELASLNREDVASDLQPRRVLDPFFLIQDYARMRQAEYNRTAVRRDIKGFFHRVREGLGMARNRLKQNRR
ncbi:MAG: hypothetical protein SFY70_00255 [Bacteroidia bacterium]|nr:hypothetical protein [Bacteroidia bacterium]